MQGATLRRLSIVCMRPMVWSQADVIQKGTDDEKENDLVDVIMRTDDMHELRAGAWR